MPVLSLIGLTLITVGNGCWVVTFWSLADALAGTAAAAGIAWINSVGNLGGQFGPHIIGRVRDANSGSGYCRFHGAGGLCAGRRAAPAGAAGRKPARHGIRGRARLAPLTGPLAFGRALGNLRRGIGGAPTLVEVHHKHGPLGNWREFAKELGIVVIGVLIALGGEQVVEAIHHRSEVQEVRELLKEEMAFNMATLKEAVDQTFPARMRRLDDLERWGNVLQSAHPLHLARVADVPFHQHLSAI